MLWPIEECEKANPALNDHSRSEWPEEYQERSRAAPSCDVCERTSASTVAVAPVAGIVATEYCVFCGDRSTVSPSSQWSLAHQSRPPVNIGTALLPCWNPALLAVLPWRVTLAPALAVKSSPRSMLALSESVKTVGRGLVSVRWPELTITSWVTL